MAVVISPDSELAKELAKWNKPWVYVEYPRMLYKAHKRPDGIWSVGEIDDKFWGGKEGKAAEFTRSCQRQVKSQDEHLKAKGAGWMDTQPEALVQAKKDEEEKQNVTAHRHYEDRNMSEAAQAEAKAVDDATFEHVPEIPRKRGRPRKVQAEA